MQVQKGSVFSHPVLIFIFNRLTVMRVLTGKAAALQLQHHIL